MKKLIIVFIIFFSSEAFAFDEWSKTDITLQAVYTSLHILDWGQTLYVADNPTKFEEINPILGSHPTRGNVNLYFAGTLLGSYLVVHLLPKDYRVYFQTLIIGLELYTVANNYSMNVGFKF